ncbi:MAG TPA: phosphomannomutase/phosphoglucomutase [Sedimentisphaerales bacterium]|nr:phosphomannomutase/phosphoglucomutase [Sedimentisphaerales bacterium]
MDPAIFNTDDITGVYPDQISEEDAWKIGCGAARFLRSLLRGYERGQANMQSLCVGRDMRTHSPQMAEALIEGMSTTGTNVIDIGMVDTPQMYFAVNHLGTCGGVQITASHRPAKYTGLKMCGLDAKPVSTDTGLKDIEHIAMALLHTKGKATGSATERDLTAEYRNHVLKFLGPNPKKMKIALDASNGMAGKMVPAIFSRLPVEIIAVNFDHRGKFKHEPDPLVEKNLADLKAAVTKNKCDFGVCFDGDASRLAVVDEKTNTLGSDLVATLMVPYFLEKQARSTVAYDVRCSRVLVEEIIRHGGTPRRERVGQAYMKKALRDSHAVFGCGFSGHFYYRDNYCAESAMITLVHLINIVSQTEVPLSERAAQLRRYHSSEEISLDVENKQAKMDEFARRYSDGQIDHLDGMTIGYKDWWFNCRPSKNEPLIHLRVEARSKELLDEKLLEVTQRTGKPA